MGSKYVDSARIFKAFCDEKRLRVLQMLQSGEKCACMLLEELEIRQPTLSHHMKILVESGIVSARKEGKWTYYAISAEGSEIVLKHLRALTAAVANEAEINDEGCCE